MMSKIIKDCIYGHIMIPPLCQAFMDVPEFQRLRRIRQLGMAHYAYPSAVHTRFEHSLGVMHLAGKMVDQLRNYAVISDHRRSLIQLAGLYHDIGHFAYSHLFDAFLSKVNLEDSPEIFKHKDHEERSLYFLRKVNNRLKLLDSEEETFVINAIRGHVPDGHPSYLYQIVCNNLCGIDVDKLDYLRRDSYHSGLPGFESDYIIFNAIVDPEGNIAFRKKAYNDVRDVFITRTRMFEKVYQHHTARKMDKIHFCLLKRLGPDLFQYGDKTDDYNIETLIRNHEDLAELVNDMECRILDHNCEHCQEYTPVKSVPNSGAIDRVRFI